MIITTTLRSTDFLFVSDSTTDQNIQYHYITD